MAAGPTLSAQWRHLPERNDASQPPKKKRLVPAQEPYFAAFLDDLLQYCFAGFGLAAAIVVVIVESVLFLRPSIVQSVEGEKSVENGMRFLEARFLIDLFRLFLCVCLFEIDIYTDRPSEGYPCCFKICLLFSIWGSQVL